MASDNVVTAEKPKLPAPEPKRRKLQFKAILGRARPAGYIHVSQALDRLGLTLFPGEWGLASGFWRLPFQYVRGKFYRYSLTRHDDRVPLSKTILNVPNGRLRTRMRLLDQRYKAVRAELRRALELKQITGKFTDESGRLADLPEGAWAQQMLQIFYSGKLRFRTAEGAMRRATVLIEEKSFEEWLGGRRSSDNIEPHSLQAAPLATAPKNKGGKPPKWDWVGAATEMARYIFIEHRSSWPTKADTKRHIEEWFEERNGHACPAESLTKDHVKRFYNALGLDPQPPPEGQSPTVP